MVPQLALAAWWLEQLWSQYILFSVVFTPPTPAITAVFGSYLSFLYS
jgi:hypothetical protein